MSILVLMRHGQSEWNKLNQFTGWVDVPLTEKGVEEAIAGGKSIQDIPFDVMYTSTLIRAQHTLMLAMLNHHAGKVPVIIHQEGGKQQEWSGIYSKEAKNNCIPVYCAWELNERMYGELQGLNKAETAEKFGADQVKIWRRSFDTPPPKGESLEMTAQRTIPYFEEEIVPHLRDGRNVFISAHGNSLRSIIMDLDGLTKEEVVNLEIATGEPIAYEFLHGSFTRKKISELNLEPKESEVEG
ncbi:MAG: 2,3-bisphosphoglycerate-dependent phosphoglycerate mutase [Chlamydiota bacterium]|nr:2,3-bisphosphoglycerate-dependent phosphoglycerate mutase [Chlamydiota bacterium]